MIVSGVFALPFDDSAGFTAPPAFGPFRVLHQIGSGALGPVFRTFEPQLEKLVAIKAFRLDVVPEVIAHLAESLRRLAAKPVEHPAVVPVIAGGIEGGTAYLASEYVAAETLDVSLRQLAPSRLDMALPVLRQLAEAIEASWAQGAGHGGLHPRDIFVLPATREDKAAGRAVRVGGFGVVAALDALKIPAPVRRPYSAPERADGGVWDMSADVYSLGVIAHELLTGRRPAADGQAGELATGTMPEDRVTIRRVLASALETDPRLRYPTPTAFVHALTTGQVPDIATIDRVPDAVMPAPVVPVAVANDRPVEAEDSEGEAAIEAVPAPVVALREEPTRQPALGHVAVAPSMYDSSRTRPHQTEPYYGGSPFDRRARDLAASEPGRGFPAIAILICLLVGSGFGYWLRGGGTTEETAGTEVVPSTTAATEAAVAADVPPPQGATEPVRDLPAATPPPSAPTEARRGRLLVRSVPAGALVTINGRARGTTPATIRDLAFGTYNVAVSRAGYARRTQRVTMAKAVPSREMTVELMALAQAAPAVSTGSVYIETRPGNAMVTIDGRAVGTAPMRVPELTPGPHTIRVDLAGHKSVTTTVVVRAGQQTPVRVSLEIQSQRDFS